jgi:hypothetical protein
MTSHKIADVFLGHLKGHFCDLSDPIISRFSIPITFSLVKVEKNLEATTEFSIRDKKSTGCMKQAY